MPSKLTLSLDPELIAFAHELARERNDSISNIVAAYLTSIKKKKFDPSDLHPTVQKMLGAYKDTDFPKNKREMRERYMREKFGV